MTKTTDKALPVHEVRLGRIKAAIWKNQADQSVRYNATFTRIYLQEGAWRSTDNFGRDDLLLLANVADQAHSWICEQAQEKEGLNH
ncbi:MAG: hypothetical protein L0Z50_09900 [Verrucomicrobiales bacterium]|nr:hypothetical protein [Verrucomicrobiales bacterium]